MPNRTRRGQDSGGEKQPGQKRSQAPEPQGRATTRANPDRDIRPRDAEGRFTDKGRPSAQPEPARKGSDAKGRSTEVDIKRKHPQPAATSDRSSDDEDYPRDPGGRFSDRNKSGSH